jgi:hypothetical protein
MIGGKTVCITARRHRCTQPHSIAAGPIEVIVLSPTITSNGPSTRPAGRGRGTRTRFEYELRIWPQAEFAPLGFRGQGDDRQKADFEHQLGMLLALLLQDQDEWQIEWQTATQRPPQPDHGPLRS